MDHIAHTRAEVPLYAYLLVLRSGSIKETWDFQRLMAVFKKNFTLPSLGRAWLRSGTVRQKMADGS